MAWTPQNFVDRKGPVILASWLNTIDTLLGVFNGAQTQAQAQTALFAGAPLSSGNGGTGTTGLTGVLFGNGVSPATAATSAQIAALLTPTEVGTLLWPQTTAEVSAGVTPVNFAFPPGAIERYYIGSGDARGAIQNALNSNTLVFSVYGWQRQFPVSDYLLVPAGVTLQACAILGTGNTSNYAPWGANHQGQSVLLNGNTARALGVWINGGNNVFGGVGTDAFDGNAIEGCLIENTNSSQPILGNCGNTRIMHNYLRHSFSSGIQLSGIGATVVGNIIRCVNSGGIFAGFNAANMTIAGNYLTDIGDVGLDLEGVVNVTMTGNFATRCVNGELNWFSGAGGPGFNCTFKSNTAYRVATATTWSGTAEISSVAITGITQAASAVVTTNNAGTTNPFTGVKNLSFSGVVGMTQINGLTGGVTAIGGSTGAWTATVNINSSAFTAYASGGTATVATAVGAGGITLHSAQTGQVGIVFDDNTVDAVGRPGIFTNQLESGSPFDCGITIKGGTITSDTQLLSVNTAPGLAIEGVTFRGQSGAETANNLVKNIYGGRIERCVFDYATAPTGSNYALDWFTDGAVSAGGQPTIANNLFYGTGDNAFNHRPVTVPAVVLGNQFTLNRASTVPFTAKGGVTVSTTMPIYIGQKLYVTTSAASLDLSTLTALNGVNQRIQLDARMLLVSGGALQNSYDFAYANTTLKSRDGSGSATGILASATWFASFATSIITFTGSPTAYIEMDLTTWQ